MNKEEFVRLPWEDYYELGDYKLRESYVRSVKNYIENKDGEVLARKMMDVVEGFVENYKSDFYVHDYNYIKDNYPGQGRMFWIVHKSGSYMIKLDNNFEGESENQWDYYRTLKDYYSNLEHRTYIINIKEGSLTKESNQEEISKNNFINCFGDVRDYFNNQTKGKHNAKNLFDRFSGVYDKYGGLPPKDIVDEIVDEND